MSGVDTDERYCKPKCNRARKLFQEPSELPTTLERASHVIAHDNHLIFGALDRSNDKRGHDNRHELSVICIRRVYNVDMVGAMASGSYSRDPSPSIGVEKRTGNRRAQ